MIVIGGAHLVISGNSDNNFTGKFQFWCNNITVEPMVTKEGKVEPHAGGDKDKEENGASENVGEVGGIAELLGKTATILSGLVKKEEEMPQMLLPTEDVETYKAAFNDFDHNKDGHISTQVLFIYEMTLIPIFKFSGASFGFSKSVSFSYLNLRN